MTILFALLFCVPALGFFTTRMENYETGEKPSFRESLHYGVGCGLGALGALSFAVWFIVWVWSISLSTPPTWISMSIWLAYSIIVIALGGLVMAATRPRV